MSVDALCLRCRRPLNDDGLCPRCDADEIEVAAKLRQLREEIARERGEHTPAEPRSRLWRRKKEKLEQAKREAQRTRSTKASPRKGRESAATPPAPSPTAPQPSATDEPAERGGGAAAPPPGDTDAVAAGGGGEQTPASPVTPSPGDRSPARVHRAGVSASGIRARELDVTDPRHGSDAVRELLEHRRRGLGKIVGIAGLPRHGKTKLADRLRERYAERPGADLRYDKTERGEVNLYYIPGRREHHVLVDVAGEDFQALGDYERELPALMRQFLWPVLQELDGLVLLMALPIVWAGWNAPRSETRVEPSERDEIAMRQARDRMISAHRMLLKYAMVARDLKRLRRVVPGLGLSATEVPTRNQVDDAVPSARRLRVPVALGFSKADLFAPGDGPGAGDGLRRVGLYTPDVPGRSGQPAPPLHPLHTDPLVLGHLHFPELFEFLLERVRYFHFDFVQALVDRSDEPDPQEATEAHTDAGRGTLLGGEGLLEFVTQHPWRLPGLDTRRALRLDRLLNPHRWDRKLLRALHDRDGRRP